MFDSHSVGTGISSSTSSSLLLFLFLARLRRNHVLSYPFLLHVLTHIYARAFCLSRSLFLRVLLPRPSLHDPSPFRRLSPSPSRRASRSAPDYLGSECLIEALYRWEPERCTGSPLSFLFLGLAAETLLVSTAARLLLLSSSHPHSLRPFLCLSTSLRLFVYLLVADTSLPRQIHR